MSTTIAGGLLYGFPVEHSDFMIAVDREFQCASGHVQSDSRHDFCPRCGAAFEETVIERPTKAFAAYVAATGSHLSPAVYYHDVCGDSGSLAIDEVGIANGTSRQGYACDKHLVVASCLAHIESWRTSQPMQAVDETDLIHHGAQVREFALRLGLDDMRATVLTLYPYIYVS